MVYDLTVNGRKQPVRADADMPLLWALRDQLRLTGAKYGCGVGLCGACTIHIDGQATRACIMPMSEVPAGARITTIEGLGTAENPHPLQTAWIIEQVPQCGFCQTGMIMAAAALLQTNPVPSTAQIDAAITNICRCGTYPGIAKAIKRAAAVKLD